MQFNKQTYELCLSKKSDWELFESIACRIVTGFGATITENLDGLEQRYWDIKIGEVAVTLHLEHYLGISLFPAKGFEDNDTAKELIKRIGEKYA